LKLELPRLASQTKVAQDAEVINGLDQIAPSYFGVRLREPELAIELEPGREGAIVLLDGKLNEVWRDDAAHAPWQLEMEPGLYLLREESTGLSGQPFAHRRDRERTHVRF
jgi:hypothetical protein